MDVRKILIPVAAGLLFSPALMAADIATGATTVVSASDEFLSTAVAASTVTGGVLSLELEAEYAVGDIITLAFSGAALEAGLLSSITSATNTAISAVTIGLLNDDASSGTYRVTDVTAGAANTTIGVVLELAAAGVLTFDAAGVDSAGGITVDYSAETDNGLALDSGGTDNTVDWITTGVQFSATVTTAFNGVIDVDDNRETFEGAETVDTMTSTTVNDAGSFSQSATLVDYDVVVTGDWSSVFSMTIPTWLQPASSLIGGVIVDVTGGTCTGHGCDSHRW